MTPTQVENFKYFIEALIVIVAARDLIIKKDKSWYKRISAVGWFLVGLAVLTFSSSIYKSNLDHLDKESEKHKSDSIRLADLSTLKKSFDSSLNKYGLKSTRNLITNTVTIRDTLKLIDPVMDVVDDSTKFVGVLPNDVKLEIDYKCINNEIAYNVSDYLLIFYIKNDAMYRPIEIKGVSVSSLKAYGNKGFFNRYGILMPEGNNPINPIYIFFKVIYSNKEVNGQKQPPLRRIYLMNIKTHPKSLNDLSLTATFEKNIYIQARKLLMEKKYW